MKTWVIAVVFLFLVPVIFAKTQTVTLDKGESFVIENINVTLIDYDKGDEKLLVCVNDQRAILSDDKRVDNVYFEIKSFKSNGVKIVLEADCDDCEISDNSECFSKAEVKTEVVVEDGNDFDGENDEVIEEGNDLEGKNKELEDFAEERYKGIIKRFFLWIVGLFR